jgi:hypothetical protein
LASLKLMATGDVLECAFRCLADAPLYYEAEEKILEVVDEGKTG